MANFLLKPLPVYQCPFFPLTPLPSEGFASGTGTAGVSDSAQQNYGDTLAHARGRASERT